MPQVDKATFLPIVFWTFVIYVMGYLFLNTTVLYSFLTGLKLSTKRVRYVLGLATLRQRLTAAIMLFPWVAL